MKKVVKRILDGVAIASDYVEKRKKSVSSKSRNLHFVLWERAVLSSAKFVEENLQDALVFKTRKEIHLYTVKLLNQESEIGIGLEFGVFRGRTINLFSGMLPKYRFFGFDSFVGLKEDWAGHSLPRGSFSQGGMLPRVNSNVELLQGWFDETLPVFVTENEIEDVRFIHIDGDTYEAAKVVLDTLASQLKPGTLILFDEYLGYPNWKNGEHKALIEVKEKFGLRIKYRAFTTYQSLVEIL